MFGVSFLEIALVALVALVVVGPQKLPEMMRTAGEWLGKLRRLTADMRVQTGIDDILREEGIDGVSELRTLLRGERGLVNRGHGSRNYGYETNAEPPDLAVEFPVEGPDARGALPDDLLSDDSAPSPSSAVSASGNKPRGHEASAGNARAPKSSAFPKSAVSPIAAASAGTAPKARTAPPRAPMSKPPSSIPPPPATPRRIPPRATTLRETPKSKSEPKITISEPPPSQLKKDKAE